jgi:hypothetical protein
MLDGRIVRKVSAFVKSFMGHSAATRSRPLSASFSFRPALNSVDPRRSNGRVNLVTAAELFRAE